MVKKQILKRWIASLLCVIVMMFLSLISVDAASGDNSKDSLVVGVPVNRCPLFYLDADTNQITGIGVDLMRFAAQGSVRTFIDGMNRENTDQFL